jgi:hypothetical protein
VGQKPLPADPLALLAGYGSEDTDDSGVDWRLNFV